MKGQPESYLESKLAKAFDEEKIPYECQYRVYEKAGDLMPMYTLDFMIRAGNRMIDVECDGSTYHMDKKRDAIRNMRLYYKGFKDIVRFSTKDIEYNINYCTNVIKRYLKVYGNQNYELKPENTYKKEYTQSKKESYVVNIAENKDKLPIVNIYAASYAKYYEGKAAGAIVFQLEDIKRKVFSEVQTVFYIKVNKKHCSTLAILESLKKMKKSSQITIYTDSEWTANVCNDNKLLQVSRKLEDRNLFAAIDKELKKHNFRFIYVEKENNIYSNEIFHTLYTKAKQITLRQKKKTDLK